MLSRDTRSSERGQTLIVALVFMALFALVAGSVLAFASTVESQRGSTERTAATDSVAEGSAQFALGDTRGQCVAGTSIGTMQFPSTIRSDTLTFNTGAGCQSVAGGGIAEGSACELCLLNSSPPNAATPVLTTNQNIQVNGEVDANGSVAVSGSGKLTATGSNAKIGLYTGATCASCSPSPTSQSPAFDDPLAGRLADLTSNGPAQTCSSCSVIGPGVYSNIGVSSSPVWMKTGQYILTGPLTISGNPQNADLLNSDSGAGSTDSGSGGSRDSGLGGSKDSGAGDSNSGATVTYPSNTTLTDSSKAWQPGQWVGAIVTVSLGGNKTTSGTVASNTVNTLTVSAPGWGGKNPPPTGSPYLVSTISYTATTLVDTSKTGAKAWNTNVWAGSVVTVTLAGGPETDTVQSNTGNTLTISSPWGTTPAAGNTYVVSTLGYTSKTLVDTSKAGVSAWTPDQWVGSVVAVTLTGGATETDIVSSNTTNTLTMVSNWSPVPSAGNTYIVSTIGYTSNTLVDTSKNWTTNWAGAVVTVTVAGVPESRTIVSSTANTLNLSPNWSPIPAAGSPYAINGTSTISYGTNTLVDTSKTWFPHQWQGAIVTVTLTDNSTETGTVSDNTANALTMSTSWSPRPASGNGYTIVAPVVIYLACNTSAPYWACPTTGPQSGGSINTSGQGTFAVQPYTTGSYAGISVFTDPNLTGTVISVSGNGGSFGGTIYAPRGSVDIAGGGSSGSGVTVKGRMIVQSLTISVNVNLTVPLNLIGTVSSSSVPTCDYYSDSLIGTEANGTIQNGDVQFETHCSSAGRNGQGGTSPASIISFDYGP